MRDRQVRDKDHAMAVLHPHQAARIDRDRILERGLGWKQLTLGGSATSRLSSLPRNRTGLGPHQRTVAGYVLVEDATVMGRYDVRGPG
jgi:hypothetical protein